MIEELAHSHHPDPAVRRRIIAILAGARIPGVDELLLRSVLDPEEEVSRSACRALAHRYPWVQLGAAKAQPLPAGVNSRYRFGTGFFRLLQALQSLARSRPEGEPPRWERFVQIPALLPDLAHALSEAGDGATGRQVLRLSDDHWADAPERKQVLLAPTYACDLNCSYCYVKGWVRRFSGHMSLDAYRAALHWCQAQGVNWIILGGGEPTVHPAFAELVALAARARIPLSLTSNGTFSRTVSACIRPPAVPEFVCHIDQHMFRHDPQRRTRLRENLQAALASGVSVRIRYTLTPGSNRRERMCILDEARAQGIPTVNYGFAFRNMDGNNESYGYEARGRTSFSSTLRQFLDEARTAGVALHLSKPFPLCELRTSVLRRLASEGGMGTSCTAFQRGYTKNLTINPDLSTLPCNAIGTSGPRLTEFADFAAAGAFHATLLRQLYETPWQPRCTHCALHYRGICQGVCLAERYAAPQWGGASKPVTLRQRKAHQQFPQFAFPT